MPLYRLHDNQIFFLHIPKTGGSTFHSAFVSHNKKHSKALYCDISAEKKGTEVPQQHYTYKQCVKNIDDFNQLDKFTLIRNPEHRTISDYCWFNSYTKKYKKHVKTIDEDHFNSWLHDAINHYKNDNSYMHNHFVPQQQFIGKDVNVFLTEDYDKMIDYINSYFDIELKVRVRKRSRVSKRPELHKMLSKEVYDMWLDLYQKDVEYHEKFERDIQSQ